MKKKTIKQAKLYARTGFSIEIMNFIMFDIVDGLKL